MKRNKDLIIELLGLWINAPEVGSLSARDLLKLANENALGPYRYDEIQYHIRLMDDIGAIEFSSTGAGETIKRVTWVGYDYYESAISGLKISK